MHCMRCHGLMMRDHFLDFDGTSGHLWACGWRCINCGHVYDAVIEQNRRTASTHIGVAAADRQASPDHVEPPLVLARVT